MWRTLFGCALALFLLTSPAWAERVVLVFNDSGYMPFFSGAPGADYDTEFTGEGMLIDLLDVFEREHPEHQITRLLVPRERANQMVEDGSADGYALNSPLFASHLADRFSFSEPIWHTADAVFVHADAPECPADAAALEGKVLGCIRGYGYADLEPGLASGAIDSMAVNRHDQLYRLLLSRRVDAIVGNIHVLPYNVQRLGLNHATFRACPPALYEFDLSVMVRNDKRAFLEDLDAFIRASRENGLLRSIEFKWFGGHAPARDFFDEPRQP